MIVNKRVLNVAADNTNNNNSSGIIRPSGIIKGAETKQETDDEIDFRIRERFEVLADLTDMVINGYSRSLIVSGPAGVGKSYTVEEKMRNYSSDKYTISRGFIRPTGLYKLLFENSGSGDILILDDSDCVFMDEISLSLMKAACDTTEERVISWRAETNMRTEDGEPLPTSFEYNGGMIFITNTDFDAVANSKDKLAPHVGAMVSRSDYIELGMKTRRHYLIRIKQVIYEHDMLSDKLDKSQIEDVVGFISNNLNNLREVSLRTAVKISNAIQANPKGWERQCRITCCNG